MAFLSFLAATLGVLGAAGAYYRLLSPAFGFYLAFGAVAVIALNFPINLARFVKKGRRNVSFIGLAFGLAALASLAFVLKFAIENPVTDVTNSPQNPPPFRHRASSIPLADAAQEFVDTSFYLTRDYDASEYEKQARAYPNIYVLELPGASPETALALASSVAAKHPEWRKVHEDKGTHSLELEEEMPFFHSVDDFVIKAAASPGGASLFLRSRSRFGFTDFGFNARRIRQFTDEYVAAANSMTPPLKVEFRK